MDLQFVSKLSTKAESKVILVVMDGIGDLPGPEGKTALEAAHTPNLDNIAKRGSVRVSRSSRSWYHARIGPCPYCAFWL